MVKINIVKESKYAIKRVDLAKIPKDVVVTWKIYNKDKDDNKLNS